MVIRDKLVIIFFVFIMVPMFMLWAGWQRTAVNSVKFVIGQGLADRARQISNQLTTTIENNRKEMVEFTRHPELQEYAQSLAKNPQAVPEGALLTDLSALILTHQRLYSSLIGVNQQGQAIFKLEARPDPNGVIRSFFTQRDFTGEDSLKIPEVIGTTAPGSTYVSEIQQDSSGPHVKIVAPLRDGSGTATGALVVKVKADALLSEAAGPHEPEAGKNPGATNREPIILSPQGTVLYARDQARQWRPYNEAFRELEKPLSELRNGKPGDIDEGTWLVHHVFRETSPQMSIFVAENYSKAVGNLEIDSIVMLAVTLLLVVVAMLALYLLVSSITDSIRSVTRGAKAIAKGNLGYQIGVKTKDETRLLAEAFNRMASRLREMIRKEGEQKQFESFARLSAVLTHDLKNQILSLSLLVNNMERKFDREGFKEDALRTLSDSVTNLRNLVTKLSDPRTPTKRIREKSNVTTLVERVIQRTAGQATSRYQISTQLIPDLYATVDGKAIERVIENLVINALESMPDGGSLMVATRAENGNAVISVADTGKGMTEEFMRERLFHPFATTKKKGIGLGLYSCRDIIEQHGGRIDVASKIDTGTEFRIVLPMKEEEPQQVGAVAQKAEMV